MIVPTISQRSFENVDATSRHFPTWLTGEWGLWQIRTIVLVYLLKLSAAWFMACLIFTAPSPKPGDVSCDVEKVMTNNGFPADNPHSHPTIQQPNGSYADDFCTVIVHKTYGGEERLVCTKFIPSVEKMSTLVTQYELYCSHQILVSITQCFHLFGILMGGIIHAEIIKSISPKHIILIGLGLQIVLGIATGFLVHFWLHVIFRSMLAMTVPISISSGQMIMLDVVKDKYKAALTANYEQFWSVGVIILPGLAYFTKTWGELYLAFCVPLVLLLVAWWFDTDSPSWYLGKENITAAKLIILKGHTVNKYGSPIPANIDEILKKKSISILNARSKDRNSSWKELLALDGSKWRLACLACAWSLMYICYFGTLLNIRNFKSGNVYYSTPIAGVCELIGGFIGSMIVMKCKNKWALSGILTFLSGIFPSFIWLLPTYVNGRHKYLHLMILQMINKIGINITLCVAFTCSPEIFPAIHKRRALYGITLITRILFISAPLIGFLAVYGDGIPLTAFGVLSMICGLSICNMSPIQEEKNEAVNKTTDTKL